MSSVTLPGALVVVVMNLARESRATKGRKLRELLSKKIIVYNKYREKSSAKWPNKFYFFSPLKGAGAGEKEISYCEKILGGGGSKSGKSGEQGGWLSLVTLFLPVAASVFKKIRCVVIFLVCTYQPTPP